MAESVLLEGRVEDISELAVLANQIAELLEAGDLLVLTGGLGAGKTTFTRSLAAALGVQDTVSSPTFILARVHQTETRVPLIHLDAYRLGSAFELDDLGLDYQASITVAEWGKGMLEHEYDSWLELVLERIPNPKLSEQDYSLAVEEPRIFRLLGSGERWQGVTLGNSGN
ncbi:MAG: tRNA (adenosine(37)-N6)-threonylcarbamoyltransferase complex ATPase subunit type 1 TsaE [Microbacteriaceae bacterium]